MITENILVYGIIVLCIGVYLFTVFSKFKRNKLKTKKKYTKTAEIKKRLHDYCMDHNIRNKEKRVNKREIANSIGVSYNSVDRHLPSVIDKIIITNKIFNAIVEMNEQEIKPTASRVFRRCKPLLERQDVDMYFEDMLLKAKEDKAAIYSREPIEKL